MNKKFFALSLFFAILGLSSSMAVLHVRAVELITLFSSGFASGAFLSAALRSKSSTSS